MPIPGNTAVASFAKTAATAEQRLQMVRQRIAGMSCEEIGEQMGLTGPQVNRQIWKAMEATVQELNEAVEPLRAMEAERLDALQMAHWAMATAGDPKHTDLVLKIMRQRAALLGLDAPARVSHEVVTVDKIDAEIAKLNAQLGRTGSEAPEAA
jgi:hypothetical protein